mmetsp:Transcript_37474/g.42831  ORF Transcript_37474/g.42831 Transcript_37474/m.42831 type:complete len:93 (+) Transcript_37474:965-1243(+)
MFRLNNNDTLNRKHSRCCYDLHHHPHTNKANNYHMEKTTIIKRLLLYIHICTKEKHKLKKKIKEKKILYTPLHSTICTFLSSSISSAVCYIF